MGELNQSFQRGQALSIPDVIVEVDDPSEVKEKKGLEDKVVKFECWMGCPSIQYIISRVQRAKDYKLGTRVLQ